MDFAPVIPQSGLAGWAFLKRTADTQKEVLSENGLLKREIAYFRENIGDIQTAEALVADRTLLKVALGAFGLEEDLPNKFFINKILEEGTTDDGALANRLADKRYFEFSQALGLGKGEVPKLTQPNTVDNVVSLYTDRSFEIAVGDQDNSLRLALTLERDLANIASRDVSNDTKWFTVMGNPPLREVFETTFQLPPAFGTLPIDKQLETFKDRAQTFFKSEDISQFSDPEQIENLSRRFLLSSQLSNQATSQAGSIALTLLQNSVLRF